MSIVCKIVYLNGSFNRLKLKQKSIGLIEKLCGCSSIAVCPFCLVAVSILLLKSSIVKGAVFITIIIISLYHNKTIIIMIIIIIIVVHSNV
jgi:hypothetical protein